MQLPRCIHRAALSICRDDILKLLGFKSSLTVKDYHVDRQTDNGIWKVSIIVIPQRFMNGIDMSRDSISGMTTVRRRLLCGNNLDLSQSFSRPFRNTSINLPSSISWGGLVFYVFFNSIFLRFSHVERLVYSWNCCRPLFLISCMSSLIGSEPTTSQYALPFSMPFISTGYENMAFFAWMFTVL